MVSEITTAQKPLDVIRKINEIIYEFNTQATFNQMMVTGELNITYNGASLCLTSDTLAPFIKFHIPNVKVINIGLNGTTHNLMVGNIDTTGYELIEFKTPDVNDRSNNGATTEWIRNQITTNIYGFDKNRVVTKAINTSYVAECNGWINFIADYNGNDTYQIRIENNIVYQNNKTGLSESGRTVITQFVAKGQTWICEKTGSGASSVLFWPCAKC